MDHLHLKLINQSILQISYIIFIFPKFHTHCTVKTKHRLSIFGLSGTNTFWLSQVLGCSKELLT